ncbi:hypothetical protein AeNC1_009326 [Aphanomyces euteiches]|nr:hypothetical protein AeNC1_009326 [Aphanomyces euteiches]
MARVMVSINAPRSQDLENASHTSTFDSEYKQVEDMTDAAHWDIEADLQFLIAHDDNDVEDACSAILSTAGDLSSGASTVTETEPDEVLAKPRPKRKARSTFELRQKEELKRLRDEVNALKGHLDSHKAAVHQPAVASFWKRTAHNERIDKVKSLKENESLREAIAEQATFIEHMQRALAAIQWLNRLRVGKSHDRRHPLSNARRKSLASLWHWQVAVVAPGAVGDRPSARSMHGLHAHPCRMRRQPSRVAVSNVIRKYYPHADSCVFIGRTVLDDAVNPPKATDMRGQVDMVRSSIASELEPHRCRIQVVPVDKSHARITTLVQIDFGFFSPAAATDNGNELADFMKGLAISESSPHGVNFPRMPAFMNQDSPALPLRQRLICEGARRIQLVFQRIINEAVEAAKNSSVDLKITFNTLMPAHDGHRML